MTDVPWTGFPGTEEPTENSGRKLGPIHPSDRRPMLRRDFTPTGTTSDGMDRLYQLQHGPSLILRIPRNEPSIGLVRFAGQLVISGFLVALVATGVHFFVSGPVPMLVAGIAMLAVVGTLLWAKRTLITDAAN